MPRKRKENADDPLVEIIAFRTGFIAGGPSQTPRLVGPGTKYKQFQVRESQLSAAWMKRVDGKPIPRKSLLGPKVSEAEAQEIGKLKSTHADEVKRLHAEIEALKKGETVEDTSEPAAVFGDEDEQGDGIQVTGNPSEAELKALAAEADKGKDVL